MTQSNKADFGLHWGKEGEARIQTFLSELDTIGDSNALREAIRRLQGDAVGRMNSNPLRSDRMTWHGSAPAGEIDRRVLMKGDERTPTPYEILHSTLPKEIAEEVHACIKAIYRSKVFSTPEEVHARIKAILESGTCHTARR